MKKFLFLSLIFIILTSFDSENSAVQFYQGSYAEMMAKAKASGKPVFIDFYTVWCGPCKNMERYTFTSPTLANYLKDNYFAFKTDAESLMGDGIELAQKYDIRFFPSMIILTPQGEVIKRMTGFQSADALLATLKEYQHAKSASHQPEKNKEVASNSPAPSPLPTYPTGEGLFKLSVSKEEEAGFGVQVGVFGDYVNVVKAAQRLEAAFHKNILLNISRNGDKIVFKVILGPFSTKEQAEIYQKDLKTKENRNGIVIDLGKAGAMNTEVTPPPLTSTMRGAKR